MPTVEQPREHPVNCPWHPPPTPVQTWNVSGLCDDCERRRDAVPRFTVQGDYVVE